MNAVHRDLLSVKEAAVEAGIHPGNFGVVAGEYHWLTSPAKLYMVEWLGQPYPLQEPTQVDGYGRIPSDEGEMVVEAVV